MSGVITGPHFLKFFNDPDAVQIGTMVAVLEIGAFSKISMHVLARPAEFMAFSPPQVTSLAAGRIGDIIGRRGTLFSGAVVFAIGGAIQTLTPGFWIMVVGRIIAGFGVGLLSYVSVPPTYLDAVHLTSRQDNRANLPKRDIPT